MFEAAFVVLGVVLALAANEWRQARVQAHEARDAITEIIAELDANRAAVAQSMAYHSTLLDTLQTYEAPDQRPSIRLFPRGFIAPASIFSTAWTSASETGALTHADFADVLHLSRAYALQEDYTEQASNIGQLIYQDLYRGGTTSILGNYRNLTILIMTFVYREQELLETYDRTLAAFAKETSDS